MMKIFVYLIVLILPAAAVVVVPAASTTRIASSSGAEVFVNPVKPDQSAACSAENVNGGRFGKNYLGAEYSAKDKIKICKGIDLFLEHSRRARGKAGSELVGRMQTLWDTFIREGVRFIPLPKSLEKDMFAAAAVFPRRKRADVFQAVVYVPANRADDAFFFYAFWHELQHVYDIRAAWKDYGRVTNYALEFNGFYIASLLSEVYRLKSSLAGKPVFWKQEWERLSPDRQHALRAEAIDHYIRNSPVLKDAWNKNRADYNFSRPDNAAESAAPPPDSAPNKEK